MIKGFKRCLEKGRLPQRGEKGFTLVELLIVIAIIGVLAAVVIPAVAGMMGRGGKQSWQSDRKTILAGVSAYHMDIHYMAAGTEGHYYPVVVEGLFPNADNLGLLRPAAGVYWTAAENPPENAGGTILKSDGVTTVPATDYAVIDMVLLTQELDEPGDNPTDVYGPAYYLQDYAASAMSSTATEGWNIPEDIEGGTHVWVIDRLGTVYSVWKDGASVWRLLNMAEAYDDVECTYP